MTRTIAALYQQDNQEIAKLLSEAVNRGLERSQKAPWIFFRADDIGFVSRQYCAMIDLFKHYRVPLALAVVPSWLNAVRWDELCDYTGADSTLWCWHQHGHRHMNFATVGKKQEFGANRAQPAIHRSLARGQARLFELLGRNFLPVFTPPWNRCSETTIHELVNLGFIAISRSRGATPATIPKLVDLQVNVDLHTRKELNSRQGLANLLAELENALASGWCGIMLHHQRMNRRAFEFLDVLLATLSSQASAHITDFPNLIEILQKNRG